MTAVTGVEVIAVPATAAAEHLQIIRVQPGLRRDAVLCRPITADVAAAATVVADADDRAQLFSEDKN